MLFAVGGRAARADIGTDLDAIYCSYETFRKARGRCHPQAISVWIKQQNRSQRVIVKLIHEPTYRIENHGERLAGGDHLKNLILSC